MCCSPGPCSTCAMSEEKAIEKLQSAIGTSYLELKECLREDTIGQNHVAWMHLCWGCRLSLSKYLFNNIIYIYIYISYCIICVYIYIYIWYRYTIIYIYTYDRHIIYIYIYIYSDVPLPCNSDHNWTAQTERHKNAPNWVYLWSEVPTYSHAQIRKHCLSTTPAEAPLYIIYRYIIQSCCKLQAGAPQ